MEFPAQPFSSASYHLDCDYQVTAYSDVNDKNIHKHCHDFFELYLLLSGRIVYNTAGTSFYLQPGDFLFINRFQEHCPEMLDFSIPYERLIVQVSPPVLDALSLDGVDLSACFTQDVFRVYHYPPAIHSRLMALLERLMETFLAKDCYGQRILGRSYLAELFVEINRANTRPDTFSFSRDNKDLGLLALVNQYFSAHKGEKITVDALAEYFFMSRFYFMHTFKNAAGMPIYQYIQRLRLAAADELIRAGQTLAAASQQCGFSDYSNYYRCFKREYGISPSAYYADVSL